ncbi:hypothetical protein [Syntrophotalea acetylenica]|uniref:Lipoprotein n=1 Tax=Syntrophotalea acetylenica TaxID=29542 RepID=A0A1L3GDP5_SYNAC|nr:hypothetical protein [Syntrophotalea acetylenica]APG24027.1 hypothetical protein A7E75_02550 [Syntrophotalea acetylenica]APG44610.1 hypothetical protein A6070_11175 [Syntrophotalea acetylenica]
MMRLLCCLCLALLVGGCASRPMPGLFTPRDQQLFVQGMDDLLAHRHPSPAFAALQQDWPESPWTRKSLEIAELVKTIQTQQKAIDQLRRDQANRVRLQNTLQAKVKTLENEREKLRQLLIDLETRGR